MEHSAHLSKFEYQITQDAPKYLEGSEKNQLRAGGQTKLNHDESTRNRLHHLR